MRGPPVFPKGGGVPHTEGERESRRENTGRAEVGAPRRGLLVFLLLEH